jgi:hypothetical protein
MNRRAMVPFILLALGTSAAADEWMRAEVSEKSSPNGQFTVRVTPGDSFGDVDVFADRPKGKYATAQWFRSAGGTQQELRTITLLNPIAPVDFIVTDDGTLVTLDNWHNVGKGDMLVVYSPAGDVRKKYLLRDLYVFRDIYQFGFSTSSINWRCFTDTSLVLNSPAELRVNDIIGGQFIVNTNTGAFEYRRGGGDKACDRRPPPTPPSPIPERVLALPWGEEVDGLRINVDPGNVTGPLPYRDRLELDLYVWIRNVSAAPIPANLDLFGAAYNFDYEIDGTWYAFDPMPPIRTPWSEVPAVFAALGARKQDLWVEIAPGAATTAYLPVPLVSPLATLQLHAITAMGPGPRFDPKPGVHTLRLRPRAVLGDGHRPPLSNTITITLKPLPAVETRAQQVSFAAGSAFGSLRFIQGPEGEQALIRQALARPPQTVSVPLVVYSTSLQVLPPLPFYDLRLQQTATASDPALPTKATSLRYLVLSGDAFAAHIYVDPRPDGPAFVSMGSDSRDGRPISALRELAEMDVVRAGDYEPRLLQVTNEARRQALTVIWLHSSSGKPDLFYKPRDPDFRGTTTVESQKLYTTTEFLAAAQAAPPANQ